MKDLAFQQALDKRLRLLDKAYASFRDITANPKIFNTECGEYKHARGHLLACATFIFELKHVWERCSFEEPIPNPTDSVDSQPKHLPDCDSLDKGPDNISKPCNCQPYLNNQLP